MEEEKKELTPEELEERLQGIRELNAKLQEGIAADGTKIQSIRYQEDTVILPSAESYLEFSTDIYFVKMETDGVVSYQIYSAQQELIATLSAEGELTLAPEFLEKLDENSKRLLGLEVRGEITLDIEKIEKRENPRDVEVEFEEEKEPEEKEEQEPLQEEGKASEMQKEEIEEDLGIQKGDLAFEADIRDNRFQEIVPEAKDYEGRVKICRVKGSREVMMIGKSKRMGKFQALESVAHAQSTNERPIKLDKDGNELERENLHGIMKYNDRYSFGYTIDSYGELNLELLREDPTTQAGYRYLSAGIETRTQYPVNEQVKEVMDHTLNESVGEEIQRYDTLREDYPTADINLADITDESERGIIRLSNGDITTFEREAAKAKVSPEEFKRIYREANGGTPEEKIHEAHEEIANQYMWTGRNREQR